MKVKYVLFFITMALSVPLFAMEEKETGILPTTGSICSPHPAFLKTFQEFNLPTDPYKRKNIKAQCDTYRKIFDPLYQQAKNDNPNTDESGLLIQIAKLNVPGLLDILKDGVLIVRDTLTAKDEHPYEKKRTHLEKLGKFWKLAQEWNDDKNFSAREFTYLNQILAVLMDDYKSVNSNHRDEVFPSDFLSKPVFIIYAHPDSLQKARGISPITFVEQYVKYPYPSYLALFDVHSTQKPKGSKQDPHYSFHNGVLKLLKHDLAHCALAERIKQISLIRWGYRIAQDFRKANRVDDAKLIESGLFILSHEDPALLDGLQSKTEDKLLKEALLNFLISALENLPKRAEPLSSNLLKEYKVHYRDWEFILSSRGKDHKSFPPTIEIAKGKHRAFPIAKQGDQYVIIESLSDFKDNMTWVINHNESTDSALTAIREERNRRLSSILKTAYRDFYVQFNKLIKERKTKNEDGK